MAFNARTKGNLVVPTEHQECVMYCQWAKMQPRIWSMLIHFANETPVKLSYATHSRLTTIGRQKGAPDYIIAIPTVKYHGLFIEMKKIDISKTNMADEQVMWQVKLREQGYAHEFCFGCIDAIKITQSYLDGTYVPRETYSKNT